MKKFGIFVFALWTAFFSAVPAFAATIEERLLALEEEVRSLKEELKTEKEKSGQKIPEDTPIVTANAKDGFSVKSQDDNFKIKLRGYIQTDGRFFTDNRKDIGTTDTFTVRRARPIIEGTVFKNYDFYIMPELGGSAVALVDAYADARFAPEARIRVGKFKAPFSVERLQSITASNFVELGLPSNLSPNRDVGVQLSGDVLEGTVNYAVGAFNGTTDLASNDIDTNNDKEVAEIIFAQPFKNSDIDALKGLGVGAAATSGHKEGTSLPTYRSPGQASIFTYNSGVSADGDHVRLSPQFYYYWNNLGLLGEYVRSTIDLERTASGAVIEEESESDSWQIQGTYVLTGEAASYKGVVPNKNFDWKEKTWGAFEVAARYGELDIDDDVFDRNFASITNSVSQANAWALGLNWYWNRNVKLQFNYERTTFDGGAVNDDRPTENVVLSRFQISY